MLSREQIERIEALAAKARVCGAEASDLVLEVTFKDQFGNLFTENFDRAEVYPPVRDYIAALVNAWPAIYTALSAANDQASVGREEKEPVHLAPALSERVPNAEVTTLLFDALSMAENRWRDMGEIIRERGDYDNAGFCFATADRCRVALAAAREKPETTPTPDERISAAPSRETMDLARKAVAANAQPVDVDKWAERLAADACADEQSPAALKRDAERYLDALSAILTEANSVSLDGSPCSVVLSNVVLIALNVASFRINTRR